MKFFHLAALLAVASGIKVRHAAEAPKSMAKMKVKAHAKSKAKQDDDMMPSDYIPYEELEA